MNGEIVRGPSPKVNLMLQKAKYVDPAYDACTLPLMEWVVRVNVAAYNGDDATLECHRRA